MKLNSKNILIFAGGLLLIMFVYYFQKYSPIDKDVDVTPASVAPMIEGEFYNNPKFGYSIIVPTGYRLDEINEYSIHILPDSDIVGQGPANFIYVSVVTPDVKNSEVGTVYNYNPDQLEMLMSIDEIGNSTNFAENDIPELSEWFEYTLVSKETIAESEVKNFQNAKPWEFPSGTTENRFVWTDDNNIYILGYYTGGDGVAIDSLIDGREAYEIIKTFSFR